MNNDNLNMPIPTAPISPLILAMPVQNEQQFDYYFIIKKRSFWCYKNYITLELNDNYYIVKYLHGVLQIPRTKTKEYIIDILKTIGIKNKHLFKIYVMNGQICLSKKIVYDLNSIISFIDKTEMIMENVKHN